MRSYAAALDWLGRFCGCRALEYSENTDPLVARNGGVCWIGDAGLELIEPNTPGSAAGRFLARYGPGMYGIALQVEDLGTAADWLRARGAEHVGDVATGYIFTRPQQTASVHLEWADKDFGDFDPHFGAALPPPAGEPLLEVPRVAYFGALVADPAVALGRLQELWPAPVLRDELCDDPASPMAALSLVDSVLQLFRMPASLEEMQRLWGPLVFRPRVHLMALRVLDLARAAQLFEREGVRTLRGSPETGEILTHPDDTAGILLAWTDRDVPGDPRRVPGYRQPRSR